jgi:tetratricopeptide (TPR) repeat protein
LQTALQLHQTGNFLEAEEVYRRILRIDPGNVDAWHLLGVLAHQTGRNDDAIEYIGRAISKNASQAIFHNNLGAAYRAAGRMTEAHASFARAVRLKPDYVDAHSNLGTVLHALGRLADAQSHLLEALRLKPDFAEAHHGLGTSTSRDPEVFGDFDQRGQSTLRKFDAGHSLGALVGIFGARNNVAGEKRQRIVTAGALSSRLDSHLRDHQPDGTAIRGVGREPMCGVLPLRERIHVTAAVASTMSDPIQNARAMTMSNPTERMSLGMDPKRERSGIFLNRSPRATQPTMAR